MKRILFLLAFALCGLARPARAVIIEGYTPGGQIIPVALSASGRFEVDAAISSTIGTSTATCSQIAVSSTTATQVLAAGSQTASLIRNCSSSSVQLYTGGSTVTTSSGMLLNQYDIESPDNPGSFQGALYAIAAASGGEACVCTFQ